APPPAPPHRGAETFGDRLFKSVCRLSGWAILAVVASLVAVLAVRAWPALSRAGELGFFTSTEWAPGSDPPLFGSLAFVWGTLATTAIALLLAVPLGVASAAYLSEIAGGTVRRVGSFLIELLAAIPSVIYGFWGVVFLAPAVQS